MRSLLGDILGSINPFSSEEERDDARQDFSSRMDNLFGTKEDRANTAFDAMKLGGKAIGWDLAADNIDRYETGMGEPVTLSHKQLGKYETIRSAEETNQNRILSSLTKKGTLKRRVGQNNFEPINFEDLRDNDRVILDDYYDADESNPYKYGLLNHDPDLALGLGSFKLRSKSKLEFQKMGNKLLPYGYVEHTINDIYNFNPDTAYTPIADPMEKSGRAKTYPVKARWKNYPLGVINIDNNKPDISGVTYWETKE